jgi:predicted nucleic acid-binding protein
VRECVLDASVFLTWFSSDSPDPGSRRLRTDFEAGELSVVAPPLLHLETINVAGRRWGWSEEALAELAETVEGLPLELVDPELPVVAAWVSRGLTAYDAAYVAVAEAAAIALFTLDASILAVARDVARPPERA